ncbi:light harvesting complex protein, partial [Nannochloropsis oceanica]
ITEIVS